MIKGLTGTRGISVSAGNTSVPYVNQNINNPITGMIRVWGSDMQVFDGSSWMNMSASYATVGLDDDTQSLLEWARKERTRQIDRERKAEEHPALKHALEAIERAEANFDLLDKITNSEQQTELSN